MFQGLQRACHIPGGPSLGGTAPAMRYRGVGSSGIFRRILAALNLLFSSVGWWHV